MNLMHTKFVLSMNTTTTSTIAAIITTSTTTTTTTLSPLHSATGISANDSMREEAMDVVVAKIISLLILTILSVLCGLLPLRLLIHTPHLFTRSRTSVDYFLCGLRLFSGGIYLATCFLHLMPDTREKMAAVMLNMGSRTTYAVPELLVMSGFYAVVFVEQIIQTLYMKALQSDVNRKRRKTKESIQEAETKRPVQIFRSTLDEDINHNASNHTDYRVYNEDEDDEDDDDNVLIDDEDDLSFDETDSDRNSLDSATRVKENLLDEKFNCDEVNERNSQHLQLISDQFHPLSTTHPQQTLKPIHSTPQCPNETSTAVLRTFASKSLDTSQKPSNEDSRNYQNSGPPVISPVRQQQHSPIISSQHNKIHHNQLQHVPNHQQISDHQQRQNEQYSIPNSSSPPPPPPPQTQNSPRQQHHQQQQQTVIQHPPLQPFDSSIPRGGLQYTSIIHRSQMELDDDSETVLPNNTCRVSVCVEGSRSAGLEANNKHMNDTGQDRDVDSGVFSTRRDCEVGDAEAKRFAKATSREVSFDRISESSSAMQDIQVKQVVDELSRTDDSSRAHFRSIIYIMALSFHGIFEGMALGLQSMKSSVWALCFAIVVHRCVLAFKLGMDLCRGEEKQGTAFLCIGTFTLISTVGIIIGILISSGASLYSDVSVPEAILQSLATGTIFYIVFFDILFKDLEGKDDLKRVSCSFVGFSLMAIVFAITRS